MLVAGTFFGFGWSVPEEAHAAAGDTVEASSIKVGDTVCYGRYPQTDLGNVESVAVPDGTQGVDWVIQSTELAKAITDRDGDHYFKIEPIAWRVLKSTNDELFLFAEKALDSKAYHIDNEAVTWEESTARSWLNGYDAGSNTGGDSGVDYSVTPGDSFIGKAFTSAQQDFIAITNVDNPVNPYYTGIPAGSDTTDKIFYLKIADMMNAEYGAAFKPAWSSGITASMSRSVKATNYAVAIGAAVGTANYTAYRLRSPGVDAASAVNVAEDGSISTGGLSVDREYRATRPALNLTALSGLIFKEVAAGDQLYRIDGASDYQILLPGAEIETEATKSSVTHNSITVNAATVQSPNTGAQDIEYAINEDDEEAPTEDADYQTSLTLESLDPDTEYYVWARTKYNGVHDAGAAKVSAAIKTAKAPITLTAIAGVTAPSSLATPVSAITGTAQYTGTVTWSPTVSGTFAYGTAYTATITLTPTANYTLDGIEEDCFTVAGADATNDEDSGVITAAFPATAKGTGAEINAPATKNAVTHNSITINAATVQSPNTGAQDIEYAINEDDEEAPTSDYQAGLTFTGLDPNTDYYVWARTKENTNYSAGTAKVSAAIKTAQININTATITAIGNQTYTGSAITPEPEVKDGTVTLTKTTDYTVSYSDNTDAGTATVTVTGTGNYTGTKEANFTIDKAGQAALAIEDDEDEITELTKQYGDSNVSLTASGGDGTGAYSWISSNTGVASISGTGTGTLVIGDVGETTITLTKAADNNYTVKTTTLEVTVDKRDVAISYVKGENTDTKVYDGNTNALSALKGTFTLNDTKSGDNSTAIGVNTGTATFASAGADTGKTVTFAGFSLSGSKASSSYNLTGQPDSTTADITKAGQATALAIKNGNDAITELTKQYGDANVSLTAAGGDGTGAYSWISSNTGVASITGTDTGTLTIGDVGTATITLKKAADTNYTEKTTTLAVTVSKRDVTISYVKDGKKTDTKVYDGNTNALTALKGTFTLNNIKTGDNSTAIGVSTGTATFASAGADTGKTVTFAGFSLSGTKASSSYNLTGQPGSTTADITKAAPTYTAPTAKDDLTYTGSAQNLITAGSTSHGTIEYKIETSGNYGTAVPKGTNAGDYDVYWELTGDANHTDIEGTKLATVNIAKADNTTLSVRQADITYGTEVSPKAEGANGEVAFKYKLKAADDETYTTDKPTNAGDYTVQASDAGTANYNAKNVTDDFTINKAAVSIKAIAGVTAPSPLATPVSAITGTAQYTGTVSWNPTVSGTFAYGTAYTATITLTPKSNYTLDGVEENSFTVAGAEAENEADSGVITAVFPETGTQPADASITPDSAGFDLYQSGENHADIAVTLNPGAHEFTALKNGIQTLTTGTDYTVSENVYTIKTSYLEKLSVDTHTLTFDMDGGTDPALSISVTDTTPELSDDATLKSLSVTAGEMELLTGGNAFSADKIGYNLIVPSDVSLVTLVAEANHEGAAIAEGNLGEKNLTVIGGAGNVFKIEVTAENEVAKKTYTVTVTREAAELSANADLKSLSVSGAALAPAFNAGTITYSASVPNAIAQITITAETADANAKVTGTGAKALNVGANKFDITVTAENGTLKTYTVTVTRAQPIPVVYPKVTSIKTPMTKMSIVVKKGKLNLKNLVGLYTTGNKPIKDPKLTWTSSKPKVATVSKTGAVKAGKKTGKTVITVKAQNGKKLKITINVVKKAKKLKKLTGKVPKLKKGKPAFITLKGPGTNITKIKWKVKGKGLKIDKFGMATATKKGKFTITATAGGKKFTKKVTVK